jgi:hypothetical protein
LGQAAPTGIELPVSGRLLPSKQRGQYDQAS